MQSPVRRATLGRSLRAGKSPVFLVARALAQWLRMIPARKGIRSVLGQVGGARIVGLGDLAGYSSEGKLPLTGEGDPGWLEEGMRLLAEVRRCLAGRFNVVVSEPWWGEEPHR